MHTKKLIGIFAAIASLALLAGCGSSQPEEMIDETTIETTETSSIETPSNLSRDEQCIEIMAYALKWAEYQQKGDLNTFMEWAKKVDALVKQYNLDDEDYEVLCQWFATQPNFMEKVQKRIQQL